MRHRSTLLRSTCLAAILVGTLGSESSAAQSVVPAAQPVPIAADSTSPAMVMFTIEGRIADGRAEAPLPLELVDRVSAEPALARLDVDSRTGDSAHPLMSVSFAFQGAAAFRAWYASTRATALLRDLALRVVEPRRHLRIVRRAFATYFPD
jgi:hypothetical protein